MDTIHGIVPKHYAIKSKSVNLFWRRSLSIAFYFDGDIAVVEVRPDAEMQQRIIDRDESILGARAKPGAARAEIHRA